MNQDIRLTQYSHGAGCGCKISPAVLSEVLASELQLPTDARLVVGNDARDDAAVYDLDGVHGIISTTDFFMPIVDDPIDFGRIAATNAISDIYAMAGRPLMAIAILGWPVETIPASVAARVIDGARLVCREAGISLAGGHSIDAPEPIFGLAVTGVVELQHLKRNATANCGDQLILTKPLGVGILSTAGKKNLLRAEHANLARDCMCTLNRIGTELGRQSAVTAMTDVTGFGLLGHLLEICAASSLNARLRFADVPRLPALEDYVATGAVPGGTHRNMAAYGNQVSAMSEFETAILADPQTSGGLLLCVSSHRVDSICDLLAEHKLETSVIGTMIEGTGLPRIRVEAGE